MGFRQAVFEGLAQDGGLLVPHFVPDVSDVYKKWKDMSFDELAFEIATLYVADEVLMCMYACIHTEKFEQSFENAHILLRRLGSQAGSYLLYPRRYLQDIFCSQVVAGFDKSHVKFLLIMVLLVATAHG